MLHHWLCVSSMSFSINFKCLIEYRSLIWSYHDYHHYSHACLFAAHWFCHSFVWCSLAPLQCLVYCLNLVHYLMPSERHMHTRKKKSSWDATLRCMHIKCGSQGTSTKMTHIHLESWVLNDITTTYLQHRSSDTDCSGVMKQGRSRSEAPCVACSRVAGSHWKCEVCVSINLTCAN